jgi:hypothetical protein
MVGVMSVVGSRARAALSVDFPAPSRPQITISMRLLAKLANRVENRPPILYSAALLDEASAVLCYTEALTNGALNRRKHRTKLYSGIRQMEANQAASLQVADKSDSRFEV